MTDKKKPMGLYEQAREGWKELLEHKDLPSINSLYKKSVTAVVLENTQKELSETTNTTAGVQNYDPVLISMVRRAMPNLMAFDICGVQPMTGPTGLIFAMRAHYGNQPNPADRDTWATAGKAPNEAFYDEADTSFAGTGTHNPGHPDYQIGSPLDTLVAEVYGRGQSGDGDFAEMSMTIEKKEVIAKTRLLKAEYTTEMAQDLKAIHGLDAESELANILSTELVAEINREVIGDLRRMAKFSTAAPLYQNGSIVTDSAGDAVFGPAGLWDLDQMSDGRWSVEKYKSLLVKINKEANAIAKETRRGRGNFIICSSNVASVLDLTGKMDYAPAIDNNLNVDDTGNTFVGMLQGQFRVYIDPYLTYDEVIVGYRGTNPYDAGYFYCPYVPMQMVRAMGENTFQPKIAFKTRYGTTANPFTTDATHSNNYYRKFRVVNL
jgi:hypothetical protein